MKIFTGKVIGKKMAKTATIAVSRFVTHPVYKKRIKKVKKYHVHDEFDVKVGETVAFKDSKPYSKMVKWEIVAIAAKTKKPVKVAKLKKKETK